MEMRRKKETNVKLVGWAWFISVSISSHSDQCGVFGGHPLACSTIVSSFDPLHYSWQLLPSHSPVIIRSYNHRCMSPHKDITPPERDKNGRATKHSAKMKTKKYEKTDKHTPTRNHYIVTTSCRDLYINAKKCLQFIIMIASGMITRLRWMVLCKKLL